MGTADERDAAARLADLLGALSLVTDLAAGVPMETSLRTCVVATLLGRAIGLPEEDRADAYYTSLLRHLGCTAFAHEAAHLASGDDHALLHTFEVVDRLGGLGTAAHVVRDLAKQAPAAARLAAIGRTLGSPRAAAQLTSAQCSQATALASDLEMRPAVVRSLGQIYERFDGQGLSDGRSGDAIEIGARLLHVANVLETQHRHAGRAHAEDEIRRRRGAHLDPHVADVFLACPGPFWDVLEAPSIWEAFLDAEPGSPRHLGRERREPLARAFGQFADLKIPSKLGHSPAVADLAERAGRVAGLATADLESHARIIESQAEPPILVGHSFGGLFVQMLLDRGLGASGVAIDPGPPRWIIPGPAAVRAALPVLLTWGGWRKTLTMSFESFQWGFAHTQPEAEQRAAYEKHVVPTPGRIYFQAVLGIGTKVNFRNPNRAPLLLIAGEKDRTANPSMVKAMYRRHARSPAVTSFKSFRDRTHWLIGAPGWEEIADHAISWAEEQKPAARVVP